MAAPVHRTEAKNVVVGAIAIVVFLLIGTVGFIVQRGGGLPGRTYTYVTADFVDTGTLKAGKDVKINGVRVGQVESIDYVDGRARVVMRLEGSYDVHEDAAAAIGNFSALGKKHVNLDLGSEDEPALATDAIIPIAQTEQAQSLEDILADIDAPMQKSLRAALSELSTGVSGHSADLNAVLRAAPDLLADLETVTQDASGPNADIDGLIVDGRMLVSRFEGREDELAGLLRGLDDTMTAVNVDDVQPLARTLRGLPPALTETRRALDTLEAPLDDLYVTGTQLRPGATALGESTPDLRNFLRTSTTPLDRVPAISEIAEPAVNDLTKTLTDARPLIQPVDDAVVSLRELLGELSPYAADVGRFFSQHDLLSGTLQGTDSKHYFAALLTAPALQSVAGAPDPLYRAEPYPVPGTAWNHATVTDNRGER